MKLLLERELHLQAEEELLVPKDEPLDVDQPEEDIHGVKESTHAEPNIRQGRKRTIEAERLKLDMAQRHSPNQFTGYMALDRKSVV